MTHQALDMAIAATINKDLKSGATGSAMSACECITPALREAFSQAATDSIRQQEQLSRLMSQKGWYVAPMTNQETITMLAPQLQAATQGVGTSASGGQISDMAGTTAHAQAPGAVPPLT